MRVLYFGTYERDYPRNAQVISCLRRAGVEVAEEHVGVWEGRRDSWRAGPGTFARLADPNFNDFRDQNHTFQRTAKYTSYDVSVSGGSQPTRTTFAVVTPEFFRIFQVEPFMGRDFTATDNEKGAARTAIISYGFWRQFLGSTTDLDHTLVKIENAPYSVMFFTIP